MHVDQIAHKTQKIEVKPGSSRFRVNLVLSCCFFLFLMEKSQSCIYRKEVNREAKGGKRDQLIESITEKIEGDESTALDRRIEKGMVSKYRGAKEVAGDKGVPSGLPPLSW